MNFIITCILFLAPISATKTEPLADAAFEMSLDDVFSIRGRGPVVTGHIRSGQLTVGDKAILVSSNDTLHTRVVGIEKFRQRLKEASAGPDNVGVELGDVPAARVQALVSTRAARLVSAP